MAGKLQTLGIGIALLGATASKLAQATSVPILDAGFETQAVPVGKATGASAWNTSGGFGGGASVYAPNPAIPGQDGAQVGRAFVRNQLGSYGVQWQDPGVKIQEGTYIINFKGAHEPGFEPTSAFFYWNFEAIGEAGDGADKTFIGGDAFAFGTFDSSQMSDQVASVTVGPGSSSIGKYLRHYFLAGGTDAGVNTVDPRASFNVDAVSLSYAPLEGGDPVPLAVADPSFEAKIWQTGSNVSGSSGIFRPAAPLFPNQQGSQLAYLETRNVVGSYGALYQDVTAIAAGTYTMTVGVAHDPGYAPNTNGLLLNFEAIGGDGSKVLLEQNSFPVNSVNSTTLTDLIVDVTIPVGSPNIGKSLRLVMVNAGKDGGSNPVDPRATYVVDNVRLDFAAAGTTYAADFNNDQKVDSADLTKWRTSFGSNAGADADKDGDSDGADLLIWQQQNGSGAAVPAGSAVPEPGSCAIAGALAVALMAYRRGKD